MIKNNKYLLYILLLIVAAKISYFIINKYRKKEYTCSSKSKNIDLTNILTKRVSALFEITNGFSYTKNNKQISNLMNNIKKIVNSNTVIKYFSRLEFFSDNKLDPNLINVIIPCLFDDTNKRDILNNNVFFEKLNNIGNKLNVLLINCPKKNPQLKKNNIIIIDKMDLKQKIYIINKLFASKDKKVIIKLIVMMLKIEINIKKTLKKTTDIKIKQILEKIKLIIKIFFYRIGLLDLTKNQQKELIKKIEDIHLKNIKYNNTFKKIIFYFFYNIIDIILELSVFNKNDIRKDLLTCKSIITDRVNQMHICIDTIKKKEERFKKCLESMKKILDSNNQEFFLACGTLLGCVRNNKFIPHDNDIDLGIFNNKFNPNIKNIIINSGKFRLKHELGKIKNSYEISFIHKSTGVSIDIFLHYHLKGNNFYCASFFGLCNKMTGGFCRWKYPIDKLVKIDFYGKKYLIPSNKEEYLEAGYGKTWRTPIEFSYSEGLAGKYRNIMD